MFFSSDSQLLFLFNYMSEQLQSFHLSNNQDAWAMKPAYENIHSFRLTASWKDKYLRNSDYWLIIFFCTGGALALFYLIGQQNIF